MNTNTQFFCEHCGAANEIQAICCRFCRNQLQISQAANYNEESGSPLASTLLKGRYRIIKIIGQGGMGTVYRAQDISLNDRPVALKELIVNDSDAQTTRKAIEAFTCEASLLAGLQHANLPGVYEHFQENGHWYMAMSYIQGETLEEYLEHGKRKKLQFYEVLEIGKQLSSVLHYLHSQQPPIIFRDVKPANIMHTPNGQIYLIDFGVARRFKPGQPKDTTPFGSIGYAPPEQFNKAQTTPRSDIYSLGATLYQLLTGHEPDSTPFRFPPIQALEPGIPKPLAALIEQMLEIDVKKRPMSTMIVEQELQRISTSVAVLQPFTFSKATVQRKRISLFVWIMMSLSICCIIIGGFIGVGIGAAITNTRVMSAAQRIAARPNSYSPKGTLTLVDPLNHADEWQPQPLTYGGQCQFVNGVFQVQMDSLNNFNNCNESAIFKNFVVQVTMTIIQGNCGGLVLRGNIISEGMYVFFVCSDGSDNVTSYVPMPNADKPTTIIDGYSGAIYQGSQKNIIAAVANGSSFVLYINDQKVGSFADSLFGAGTVGFIADDESVAATVNYQDAIIWTLP